MARPIIKYIPKKDKKVILAKFRSDATAAEFKYMNQFVFFGKEGVVYFFGKGIAGGEGGLDYSVGVNKAISEAQKIGILPSEEDLDLFGSLSPKPDFKSMFKPSEFHRNAGDNEYEYRFIILTTRAQIITKGTADVFFETPKKSSYTPPATKTPPSATPGASPTSDNFGYRSGYGNRVVQLKLGDISIFTVVMQKLFSDLNTKIQSYDIKFDTSFNPIYYADLMNDLDTKIREVLETNKMPLEGNRYIKLEFTTDFTSLEKMLFGALTETGNMEPVNVSSISNTFSNQTLNSLIYNLPAIYKQYNTKYQLGGSTNASGTGTVFLSADEIKSFLNKYVVPLPSLSTSSIIPTKSILNKFILGDERLLDDQYYNNYQISRRAIPAKFKQNLSQEISQQYEAIGDFLGDQWVQGKYSELKNVDDIFDQLLDYISIPDLIKLAAKCLLQIIPLDDLMDTICDWILEEDPETGKTWFETHLEDITTALEKMDDGIAKDIAGELTQVYFELLDKSIEYSAETAKAGIKKIGDLIAFTTDVGMWSSTKSIQRKVDDILDHAEELIKALGVGETSILARQGAMELRRDALQAEYDKLDKKLERFGPGAPGTSNQNETKSFYVNQIGELDTDITKLKEAANNTEDQLRLYNWLVSIKQRHWIKVALTPGPISPPSLVALNNKIEADNAAGGHAIGNIMLYMVSLNPYLTTDEKTILYNTVFGSGTTAAPDKPAFEPKHAADALIAFNNYVKGVTFNFAPPETFKLFKFAFSSDYTTLKDKLAAKKHQFDLNLINIKRIVEYIDYLAKLESGPSSVLRNLAKFGADTATELFGQLMDNGTKKRKLCLAIIQAVPAVGYLIYQLADDPAAAGEYFVDQGTALYKGFLKRVQMFSRTDYPVNDILKSLNDALAEVGMNLARDILINGILATINLLREECADEDKINAPYSPMGAVDLSSFITNSKKGADNTAPDALEKSNSYNDIISISPDISADQFSTILSTLSEAFSIKEMCSLLDKNTPTSKKLYKKAIASLNSLSFLKGTHFHGLYINEAGIENFFKLISKDIEPAFCAQALNNFAKEKTLLLKICFGRDDTVLEHLLCKDMTPEECLKLLAAKAAMPKTLLNNLLGNLSTLFGDNQSPDPCADKEGIFDASQKYSAKQIGNSIFGGIETWFEDDISKIKNIYGDTALAWTEPGLFAPGENNVLAKMAQGEAALSDIDALSNKIGTDTAGMNILLRVQQNLNRLTFSRPKEDDDNPEGTLNLRIATEDIDSVGTGNTAFKRTIKFEFNPDMSPNNTTLEVSDREDFVIQPTAEELAQQLQDRADWEADNQDLMDQGEEWQPPPLKTEPYDDVIASWGTNKFTSPGQDTMLPDEVFNIVLGQPDYAKNAQDKVKQAVMGQDYYFTLLNSILKDLFATAFKSGLYKRSEFNKLNLNKSITIEKCFLGFMNKRVLIKQMLRLAEKLVCYDPNSATLGPVNVAIIKIALDCLIRTIAVKELMKSLFVYGLFPVELPFDDEASFYDQYITSEIERALKENLFKGNFYDEVIKGFITDIVKIMYQDDTMDHEEAFKIVKDAQINFVKHLMIQTVSDNLSASVNDISEYQMIEGIIDGVESSEDLGTLDDWEMISYTDKIQAIQNDYFTLYADSFNYAPTGDAVGSHADDRPWLIDHGALTKINFDLGSMPTFVRTPTQDTTFFDYLTLQQTYSDDIETILQGIDDGIVLEKMIEVKPNTSFIANMGENYQYFLNFLREIGKYSIVGAVPYGLSLSRFLYETKLIMLFPQLRKIVNSMGQKAGTGALWEKYWMGSTNLSKMGPNLFLKMFLWNYDPQFAEGQPDEWASVLSDPEIAEDFDWSITGKCYLNDLEALISEFRYPYFDADSSLGLYEPAGYNELSENQYFEKYVLSFADAGSTNLGNKLYTAVGSFYRDVFQNPSSGWGGDINIFNNLLNKNWNTAFADGTYYSFFKWFYKLPVNNILNTSVVLRLNGYVKDLSEFPSKHPEKANAQDAATKFQDSLFPDTGAIDVLANLNDILSRKKVLLEEKIGKFSFLTGNSSALPTNLYIGFPVFEVKTPLPEHITWYNFFLKMDKLSYLYPKFYQDINTAALAAPNGDWKVNDLLILPNKSNDICSYLHRFKGSTGLNTEKQKKVFVTKYQSTQWFNIKGVSVSKEQILKHVGLDRDDAQYTSVHEDYEHLKFGMSDEYVKEHAITDPYDGNPWAYLTDDSLASLQRNKDYFLKPDGTVKLPQQFLKHDDGDDFVGDPKRAALTVGSFTINAVNATDPAQTAKMSIPRYIRLRNKYHTLNKAHYSPADAGNENWWTYIDYGWLRGYHERFVKEEKELVRKYPGSEWDPSLPYDLNAEFPMVPPIGIYPWGNNIDNVCHWEERGGWCSQNDPNTWETAGTDKITEKKGMEPYWKLSSFGGKWSQGWAQGGLASAKKSQVALDLTTVDKATGKPMYPQYNAYSFFGRMIGNSATDMELFRRWLVGSFFIKEQTSIIALLHKFYAELYYPAIDGSFDTTIKQALNVLEAAVSSANGDYQQDDAEDENSAGDLDFGLIVGMLLKMFFGAMANTVDPMWQTPWFMPGPFTPFGVVAKLLDGEEDLFKGGPASTTAPRVSGIPIFCDDVLDEQVKFFDVPTADDVVTPPTPPEGDNE